MGKSTEATAERRSRIPGKEKRAASDVSSKKPSRAAAMQSTEDTSSSPSKAIAAESIEQLLQQCSDAVLKLGAAGDDFAARAVALVRDQIQEVRNRTPGSKKFRDWFKERIERGQRFEQLPTTLKDALLGDGERDNQLRMLADSLSTSTTEFIESVSKWVDAQDPEDWRQEVYDAESGGPLCRKTPSLKRLLANIREKLAGAVAETHAIDVQIQCAQAHSIKDGSPPASELCRAEAERRCDLLTTALTNLENFVSDMDDALGVSRLVSLCDQDLESIEEVLEGHGGSIERVVSAGLRMLATVNREAKKDDEQVLVKPAQFWIEAARDEFRRPLE